jgi:DNA-binding CsgD family transcriptional regulator
MENEVNSTILCYELFDDVNKNLYVTYSEMLIILPIETVPSKIIRDLKTKTNQIYVIGIASTSSDPSNQLFDFIFHINDKVQKLTNQIKTYISKSDAETNDELTIREKEVLRLIALGQTNKSIAETLFISTHTVISHRKNITEKLGIKSIPGLTVYAILQKIISQDDITKNN